MLLKYLNIPFNLSLTIIFGHNCCCGRFVFAAQATGKGDPLLPLNIFLAAGSFTPLVILLANIRPGAKCSDKLLMGQKFLYFKK